jgi:hypothetical protein
MMKIWSPASIRLSPRGISVLPFRAMATVT